MNVGIIGSGQLGRMLIMEGRKLPFRYYVCDREKGPAAEIADGFYNTDEFRAFVDVCDVITYEFEHVDEKPLNFAERQGKLFPSLLPVELKRSRIREMEYLDKHGLPVPEFRICHSLQEVRSACKELGKTVVKYSTGGYDGKGIWFISGGDLPGEMREGDYLVEEYVDYDYEASIILSRDGAGNIRAHTPSLNVNMEGILVHNRAPVDDTQMTEIAAHLASSLNYVGVMGVEFLIRDGRAIINEFAPRVHNSGHHTLHGSSISQFEQHIRTISGMPCGKPTLYMPSGIVNLLGVRPEMSELRTLMEENDAHLYWYGKSEIRKRRKVGHINLCARTVEELDALIDETMRTIYGGNLRLFL
ncbi:MAG: 5-(carboxyamino)imidazole ribonucleotide synthase [Methanomassiliicoccales archaeon]